MTRYFAYGANMDALQMEERCPGARQVDTEAMLPNHRFRIAAAGYGTVVPEPLNVVFGVLWELEPADEAALDRFEGVPEGLYQKGSAMVLQSDGTRTEAMLYRATDSGPGFPAPGYLENILLVAESLNFPESYTGELRQLLAVH